MTKPAIVKGLDDSFLNEIEKLLSPKRVAIYKQKFSTHWFESYKSEMQQTKEFLIYLHFLEIFLRNRIATELSNDFGKDWFLVQSNLEFYFKEREKIDKVISNLNRDSKDLICDNVISNLSLGFWTNLFHKSYWVPIWQINQMLERVFPFLNSHQRNLKQLQKELEFLRKFRNRVFHFENLQSYDLDVARNLIDKFIFGISKINSSQIL